MVSWYICNYYVYILNYIYTILYVYIYLLHNSWYHGIYATIMYIYTILYMYNYIYIYIHIYIYIYIYIYICLCLRHIINVFIFMIHVLIFISRCTFFQKRKLYT